MAEDTMHSPPNFRRRGAASESSGRTLPHSLEAEEYLLACCLIDGADVISRCLEAQISKNSFFDQRHGLVFQTLFGLYTAAKPISVEVLAEELTKSRELEEIGGYPFLIQVSGRIPTTAQAQYFIERVRELHLLRELIRASTSAVEDCYGFSGDIDQFVDAIETKIFKVTQNRVSESAKPMRQPTKDAMNVIYMMMMKKGEMTGVSSGFKDLDALTFGFQKQEMIILAARPSMGKTSLALNIAESAAFDFVKKFAKAKDRADALRREAANHPEKAAVLLPEAAEIEKKPKPDSVLVFSLEMSATQLAQRMLCSRAKVNMKLLRDGLLSKNGEEQTRLVEVADEFSKAPIFIDDSSALSIMQLRAKARRVHQRNPLGFIVVDYLQLLSPTDGTVPREQQVAEASRGLKSLAKELDVPVLVLSQLNRSSEKENRTPKLADLRESGSIEQDADVVLMLARPRDADEKFQVAADSAELIVAKQRNGPVGELKLTFLRDITRFENFHQ